MDASILRAVDSSSKPCTSISILGCKAITLDIPNADVLLAFSPFSKMRECSVSTSLSDIEYLVISRINVQVHIVFNLALDWARKFVHYIFPHLHRHNAANNPLAFGQRARLIPVGVHSLCSAIIPGSTRHVTAPLQFR